MELETTYGGPNTFQTDSDGYWLCVGRQDTVDGKPLIVCRIADKGTWYKISDGDRLTIWGKCRGSQYGTVILEHCVCKKVVHPKRRPMAP